MRQRDVGGCDVVLQVDERLAARGHRPQVENLADRVVRAVRRRRRRARVMARGPGRSRARSRASRKAGAQRQLARGSTRRALALARLARPERAERRIVDRPGAGLAVEVHGRLPAARDRTQIALDAPHAAAPGAPHQLHPLKLCAAQRPAHDMAHQRLDASRAHGGRERAAGRLARVDHRRDRDPGGRQVERGAIGVVAGHEHDRAAAGRHRIAVDVGARRTRQHHARPVVAGEDQRPLERTARQHHLSRPHRPQALAGCSGADLLHQRD